MPSIENCLVTFKKGAIGLPLYIQPGGKKSEVLGWHNNELKVRIAAPPVEGKANQAVIEFFSIILKVKKSQLKIAKGELSRHKTLAVEGIDLGELVQVLSQFE